MSNTIREDVVSISFDVKNNPFADITAGVNEMKTAVIGGVDASNNKIKGLTQGLNKIKQVTSGDMGSGLKSLKSDIETGGVAIGLAKSKFDSFKNSIKQIVTHPIKTLDNEMLMLQMSTGRTVAELKNLAKTKLANLKSHMTQIKSVLTGGEAGARGFVTALKSIGKISVSKALTGLSKLKTKITQGQNPATKLTTALKKAASVTFNKVTGGLKSLATHAGKAALSVGKIAGKATIAGIGAAGVAVGGLVTKSVQAYAEYEQLIGGVDTLFKESSKEIQKYANDAYKTAGLSANQYMETVTSFSASLLQSVGGDTKKAASLADMAIRDMSDNANKMGTDMESIQNAYQGFAKGNYTMLDNLKLGYGGTKEEMARLVKDAAKIDKSVDANSMSYGNLVKAIHAVQNQMGITGTTAKEAEQTISGSLAGMKSAWGNLLTSLVQGGDSFDQCMANFIASVKTFAGNVMPVAQKALTGIVTLIQQLAPVIIAELPKLLSTLLPQVVNAGIQILQTLVTTISSNVGMIGSGATQLITQFVQFLLTALPQIITTGMQLILSLVNGISQQLPTLIPMAVRAITTLVQGLVNMLPQIISAGIRLIVSLIQGITQSLPQLIPAGVKAIVSLIQGITNSIPQLLSAALKLIPVVLKAIITNLPQILEGGIKIIVSLIKGLGQAIPQLISFLPKIAKTIISSLKEIDLLSVGKDLIRGFINGIKSMLGSVKDAAKNIAKSAGNAIKGFLGINSPAKLTIGFGKFTGEGLVVGLQKMKDKVTQAAQGLSTNISTAIKPEVSPYTPSSSSVSNTTNSKITNTYSPHFTLNMNGASATEANKHKVKRWIKECLQELFEDMGSTNPELCEV